MNYWDGDVYVYKGGKVDDDDEKEKIEHVRIDPSVIQIEDSAFLSCSNLSTVIFSKATKRIGGSSFRDCSRLRSLDLQEMHIEVIDRHAFAGCTDLTSIIFSPMTKRIEDYCFNGCTALHSIVFQENSVEWIGHWAFRGCSNLSKIDTTSSSATATATTTTHTTAEKEYAAFGYCVKLPFSLQNIGHMIFYECPKLVDIIHTNFVHYQCDLNRGGRYFLKRDPAGSRTYPRSLWPLILYRVLYEMELPKQSIRFREDNLSLYTNIKPNRRFGVVYYVMVHGVAMDLSTSGE